MSIRFPLFAVATVILAATASAQDPVKWTATTVESAAPGGEASVKLAATIDNGWHIYSVTQGPGGPFPTKIALPKGQPFTLAGPVKSTQPDVKLDPNFRINVETYEKSAEFVVPIKVAKNAKAGARKVQINALYQVCNASMCLPPKNQKFSVDMSVKRKGGK